MANEASVTIVARMRDEASKKMQQFGGSIDKAQFNAMQLQTTLTAVGSSLTALGSLINQIDNPTAKMASNFFMIGGAILTTSSAIMTALPKVIELIGALRNMVIVQSILSSLTGAGGLAKVGLALAVGAGAYAATTAAMGGFSGQKVEYHYNIKGATMITDDASIDSLARKMTDAQRANLARGR